MRDFWSEANKSIRKVYCSRKEVAPKTKRKRLPREAFSFTRHRATLTSELYMAIKMGRKAIGAELKESYFKQAVRNLDTALLEQGSLFAA